MRTARIQAPAPRARICAATAGLALLLAIAGCGAGSGTGSSDSGLSDAIGRTRSAYQILDLASGTVQAAGSVPDLLGDPAFRSTKMVFRLVDAGATPIGTASGALGAGVDPVATSAAPPRYYLAVFETTQAQWQALAGSSPWTTLLSATSASDIALGNGFPAIGISHDLAVTACAGYLASHHVQLGLPSDVQWEVAARSGGGTFAWGESQAPAVVAANALLAESAGGARGAQAVGGLLPTALGFYDLHGNAWEQTSEGHLRGGSWNDPVSTARAAHRADIDPATRHLLVGVRFVYRP
jgi:formylglycine-generating enzyme required for sulfatase activity